MELRLFNKRLHRWLGLGAIPIGGILLITGIALNHEKMWSQKGGPILSMTAVGQSGADLLRGTPQGLERSSDGGHSWTQVETPWPTDETIALSLHPLKPNVVYAAMRWLGLIRSLDGGRVWESIELPFRPETTGIKLEAFSVSSQGRLYLETSAGLLSSLDEGRTWDQTLFNIKRQDPALLVRSLHNAYFFGPWAIPLYDATAVAFGLLMVSGILLWRKTDVG